MATAPKYLTQEEVLAELEKIGVPVAAADDTNARTAKEWGKIWNMKPDAARELLAKCKANGLIAVTQKTIIRLDDKPQVVAGYRFTQRGKDKK
tara:strand:+ start:1975 stop:2253 length:279 start_codon:yes stop_codon:yes gene_type:complete